MQCITRACDDVALTFRGRRRGAYVMPYVDYVDGARDAGEYLVLDNSGDIATDSTSGVSNNAVRCSCGECHVDEDDARCNDNGDMFCDECYSERYSWCEYYEEDYPADGFREVRVRRLLSGRWHTAMWSEDAFSYHGFTCANNGHDYSDEHAVTMADGETWSQDAFEDEGFVCEGNSECYPTDEAAQLEDGTYWSKEHFKYHGGAMAYAEKRDGKLTGRFIGEVKGSGFPKRAFDTKRAAEGHEAYIRATGEEPPRADGEASGVTFRMVATELKEAGGPEGTWARGKDPSVISRLDFVCGLSSARSTSSM